MSTALSDRKRTLIFINIIITCIASSMLATALTTALPGMIEDFSISLNTGQWLTSGYSLAMGIMMPLTAFLINRFPTRRLYLAAIICFIAGLVLCVIAPSFPILMSGRILQACGNGILTSMAQVILLTIYPDGKKGTVMGWYGLSIGAAPVIAPTLAGFLVDYYGWRMIFYAAIVIMLVSLVFAVCVFSDVLDNKKMKFDVVSFVLSAFAFGGLTLGIGNLGTAPFVSIQVLGALVIGIVSAIAFALKQIRMSDPFLDLSTLRNRSFTMSVIGSMILYLVMMASSTIMPLYVQTIMGYSATISGLVVLPGSVVMAILNPFTGKIYDKLGMRSLFLAGAIFLTLSTLAMSFVGPETPLVLPAIYNAVRCAAIGCLMMPFVTWGVGGIDKSKTAHATALLTSLRTISGAIGSAVFIGIMTAAANSLEGTLGDIAQLRGMNITFLCMAAVSFILLLIGIFLVKNKE